ncbi:MAG: zinc ABC transporter substrate-binding protein [Acidimicrobiia bacterium]|nr:zinc ABC transporter substrate-binding protein [Acidimicrobiia bacterium]
MAPPQISRVVRVLALVVGTALVATLTGCGSDRPDDGRLQVVAAFYPLAWMAQGVGGDRVDVRSLTGAGQEPHDVELAARDVGAVVDADAVVYLRGFQPAIDDATHEAHDDRVFDAAPAADLDRRVEGGTDPHFWLDPVRFEAVTKAFASFLAQRDPAHAAAYATRRDHVVAQLHALDTQLRHGLASCRHDELVTSHEAFGYLAARYGLRQVGITGIAPEAEPSPRQLAAVSRFVDGHHVDTIYFEPLVSSDIADAVASETGARTAVLDPIESLSRASAGDDYPAVLRADLRTLRRGQGCR